MIREIRLLLDPTLEGDGRVLLASISAIKFFRDLVSMMAGDTTSPASAQYAQLEPFFRPQAKEHRELVEILPRHERIGFTVARAGDTSVVFKAEFFPIHQPQGNPDWEPPIAVLEVEFSSDGTPSRTSWSKTIA